VGATASILKPVDDYVSGVEYFLEVSGRRPVRSDAAIRERYGNAHVVGWEITLETKAGGRQLDVVLRPDYPFSQAKIGAKRLDGEQLPDGHLADGFLCLFSSADVREVASDERELSRALQRASDLLSNPVSSGEFREEFINYWNRHAVGDPVWSLLTSETPYGAIVTCELTAYTLVAPNEITARHWLKNRYPNGADLSLRRGYYLPGEDLPRRLQEASRVRTIAEGDASLKGALLQVARERLGAFPVVFRLPGEFALVAGVVKPPPAIKGIVKRAKHPGFRPGKELPSMLLDHRFGRESPFEHSRLRRVDEDWVLSRGGEEFDRRLFESHVCLIGVGSLGSSIARMLIKAGVGRLTLIDSDCLTWDNVARHELGGTYVDQYKAKSTAEMLRRDFPFIEVRAINARWQSAVSKSPDLLQADVILSTTGSWPDEWQLSLLFREEVRRGTLMFGWIENHAAASQVLVVTQEGGCLGCGMDSAGSFSHAATLWDEPQSRFEPACSTMYGPYADLAAQRARISVSNELLRVLKSRPAESYLTTEIPDQSILRERGGRLSEVFAAEIAPLPAGIPYASRRPWPRCELCAGCRSAA
jgi:hypothetical protein